MDTPRPDNPALVVRDLADRRGRHPVLHEVDFELSAGRVLAIMGQNGAGKSTLLDLLAGVRRPAKGHIDVLGGGDPWRSGRLRARIGYQAQDCGLYPELTVAEHLQLAARRCHIADRSASDRAIAEHGLEEVKGRVTSRLSGGYRRRLALAMALIHEPDLVLLDEPAEAMDPTQRQALHRRIGALRGRRTIVMATHRVEEALALADEVLVLYRGRVLSLAAVDADDDLVLVRVAGGRFPELDCVAEYAEEAWGRHRVRLREGCSPSALATALGEAGVEIESIQAGREARAAILLRQITEGQP